MFRVDADAGIFHADLRAPAQMRVVHHICRDGDRAAVWGEFDGVDNNVIQRLLQQFGVSQKRGKCLGFTAQFKGQAASREIGC